MPSNWADATQRPAPECPHCGGRDVECLGGRLWFCDGCGKTFTVPPPAPK